MRHSGLSIDALNGLGKGDEHPGYTSLMTMALFAFNATCSMPALLLLLQES